MKLLTTILMLVGSLVSAQESNRFTYGLGAGFTTGVGTTGSYVDMGWNVRGNAGINFNNWLGVSLNVGYDSMGINSATLANIGAPGGFMSVFSMTVDPEVHLTPKRRADLYVFGGGGWFRQEEEFSQPSTNLTPPSYPTLGFYSGFSNSAVGNYSVNKAGIDAGLGVNIKALGSGKIFAEARYDRIFLTNGYHSDFVPVTFGYRW